MCEYEQVRKSMLGDSSPNLSCSGNLHNFPSKVKCILSMRGRFVSKTTSESQSFGADVHETLAANNIVL